MKILSSSRGLFALAFFILVATNVIVLAGVASNRSADPEALIKLTERELQLPHRVHEENSGLALRLTWRALGREEDDIYHPGWRSPAWLTAEKLRSLGFQVDDPRVSRDDSTHDKHPIPREVFVVLEVDGNSYRDAVKRAEIALEKKTSAMQKDHQDKGPKDILETARKRLARERASESRLFAVDAGLEPHGLRERYDDRTRFIITRGLIEPGYTYEQDRKEVLGYIRRLSVESIHVPLRHRKVFDAILIQDEANQSAIRPPRYDVELAYGHRLEPWIVSVGRTDDK